MGTAKPGRSTSPLVACSDSPSQDSSQDSSTDTTVDSTISYYSPAMDIDPKDMPETAFVIAFCVKFRCAINNISFWPEDLDEAICCKEGPNILIESLHKAFIQNLELKKSKNSWIKKLSILINDWREKGHDFFADHNPIERANYDYYSMSNRDKVMIMQVLVTRQLSESAEIKRIRREHNEIMDDDDAKPLQVEVLGEDSIGSRYYYIGIGVRIYREVMIANRVKWETVSSTVDELKKFIFDYHGLNPNRSDRERVLYEKLVTAVLPYLELLENERKRLKGGVFKVERDREIRLKKIEKDHNDSEILMVRTRSQAKLSVHEVKNTTGYLETIKKPDPIIVIRNNDKRIDENTTIVDSPKFINNANDNVRDLEGSASIQVSVDEKIVEPIMSSEDENMVATNEVKDPIEISKTVDSATTNKVSLEDVVVASEDMSDRNNLSKNERDGKSKKVTMSYNPSSKMNLSSILTEEASGKAESVEQHSELSKMSISNILSNENSTNNKYFDPSKINNENNEQLEFVQYGSAFVSFELDDIVRKAAAPKENGKDAVIEKNDVNTSNVAIITPSDVKGKTVEAVDGVLSEQEMNPVFIPDEETMLKLEWSLNHPVFRLDEEIFGGATDTELSECCSDCAMELD